MYRLLLAAILFLGTAFVAGAAEGDWRVSKASQQVEYTVDKTTWKPVKAGDIIPNNAWISTGPRGRAQIVRGVESVTFHPNTVAGLFTKAGLFERKTDVYQQIGTIELEIEKRGKPHTTVQTPFLAAVVKGTNFRVEVTRRNADVSVNRGLVQVTSYNSGQRTDVGPGQSAAVDASRGMTVSGRGTTPSISSVAPSASRVPAIGSINSPSSKPAASPNSSLRGQPNTSKGKGATGEEKSGSKNSNSASGSSGTSGNGKGNGGTGGNHSSGHSSNSGNANSGSEGQGKGQGNNGQGNGNGGSSGDHDSGNGKGGGNAGSGGNGNSGTGGHGNGQGNNGQGNGNGGSSGNNNSGNGNGKGNGG